MNMTLVGRSRRFKGGKLVQATIEMQIEIDAQALANYFAKKLDRSRSGKSIIQNGAIVARVKSRREVEL